MSIDPRRRHEIALAVVAYDSANPPLPRIAARLLAAMFPTEDVCQRSLDDIATTGGLNRKSLTATLRRLVAAGFLSRTPGSGVVPATYRLHLPPRVQP
jgi:DNA-binding IclR family transcriptional regulator